MLTTTTPASNRPLIVEVKRHSLEDGPGIRSVVFFKGCPLRCNFCQNPETQEFGSEIAYSAHRCLACSACEEACPNGAASLSRQGRIDRARCQRCGTCAAACPTSALRQVGTFREPEDLVEELLRDRSYYRASGGGVTLSGGECTLHTDYLECVLQLLKSHGIHVALQTSGELDYEPFARLLLPHLDLIFFDVKLADGEAHRRCTGRSNRGILENLRRLLAAAADGSFEVVPTMPLIPKVTCCEDNLCAVADLLREEGATTLRLLPYNPMGFQMYGALGREPPPLPETLLTQDEQDWARDVVAARMANRGT